MGRCSDVFRGHRNDVRGRHLEIGVIPVRGVLGHGETCLMAMPGGNRVFYKRSYGMPMTCPIGFLSHRSGLLSE